MQAQKQQVIVTIDRMQKCKTVGILKSIGTASANSAKFRGIRPRMYIEDLYFNNAGDKMTLTLYNVTLASEKRCSHNNKFDCSKTNNYK